ncbi:MAG: hypothetical protein E7509_01675 [Ruminococcus sp.]|nr:hypothetical protein [Ruminococcus sp.]
MKEKKKKEVEVKSIKYIDADMDVQSHKVDVKKVEFDLNGKQKEEIMIQISPKRLKQLEKEKKRKAKAEKKLLKREERQKAKELRNKLEAEQGIVMPEFMFINVGAILIVGIAVILCLYLFERSSGISEHEKRELYEFPEFTVESYFDGSFTQGITNWYTDTVPNRDKLKSLVNRFKGFFGISQGGQSIIGNAGADIKHEEFEGEVNTQKVDIYIPGTTGTSQSGDSSQSGSVPLQTTPSTSTSTGTSSTTTSDKETNNKPPVGPVDTIENGILIVNKGTDDVRAMELYGGGFDAGRKYAGILNSYKKDLAEALDGRVNVYSMCIPMAVAYYLPNEFKNQSASIPDNILNINSYLEGVVSVDAYNALKKHKNEYIYSRTDHHWQPLGAYYAAEEFAKQAMVDFKPLSEYEKKIKNEFVGTLYGHSGEAELEKNPDKFIYYVPKNNYTTYNYNSSLGGKVQGYLLHEYATGANTYSMFLGDDKIVAQIDTDVKNGRTLVVFKDSFGNALIPFLVGSFEHIYVVDYRYCNFNAVDFCVEKGATDVLFATSMFTCTSSGKVPILEANRTK